MPKPIIRFPVSLWGEAFLAASRQPLTAINLKQKTPVARGFVFGLKVGLLVGLGVLGEGVVAEVLAQVAPGGMDVVGAVLEVGELKEEG
ncbi:MAG: hypothetical protein EBX95_14045, partial [Acidimicrobiia bacterium]|nr:hypothetical protein [Acidimicrobiia bacterium]